MRPTLTPSTYRMWAEVLKHLGKDSKVIQSSCLLLNVGIETSWSRCHPSSQAIKWFNVMNPILFWSTVVLWLLFVFKRADIFQSMATKTIMNRWSILLVQTFKSMHWTSQPNRWDSLWLLHGYMNSYEHGLNEFGYILQLLLVLSVISSTYNLHLVGGMPTPLKNMTSSVWMIIPNIWKKNVPNHQSDLHVIVDCRYWFLWFDIAMENDPWKYFCLWRLWPRFSFPWLWRNNRRVTFHVPLGN